MPKKAELEQELDELKQKSDDQQATIDELNKKRDEQEAIIADLKRQHAEEIAAARNAQQPELDAQDLNHRTQLAILQALQQLQRPNPTP
jgi:predicted  nucleic acid-binding Zn-ribbon protein